MQQFMMYIAGQKRRATDAIRRVLCRRTAIEPLIGHLKVDHMIGRNTLAHTAEEVINAILVAAGCNFRRIFAWIKLLCSWFILIVMPNHSV
jgi:IS5 family transposase